MVEALEKLVHKLLSQKILQNCQSLQSDGRYSFAHICMYDRKNRKFMNVNLLYCRYLHDNDDLEHQMDRFHLLGSDLILH